MEVPYPLKHYDFAPEAKLFFVENERISGEDVKLLEDIGYHVYYLRTSSTMDIDRGALEDKQCLVNYGGYFVSSMKIDLPNGYERFDMSDEAHDFSFGEEMHLKDWLAANVPTFAPEGV